MVTSGGHVRLLDFGVAKAIGQSTLTRTGGVVGTLAYMAPEQVRGEDIDGRVDVWSTGLVLYEMLTGKHPFFGSHSDITIFKILNESPPVLGELCQDAPEALCRLIHRCLSKDRAGRPQSIEEVAESLRDLVRPVPIRLPPNRWEQFVAWFSGLRWWLRYTTVAASVLVLALVGRLVIDAIRPPPQPVDLAVLPFVNVGADSLLVGGLFYTVNSSLARLEGRKSIIHMVPPDDILYRDVRSSDDAFNTFGVDLVLSPKAQDAADELIIYIDLIEAENERLVDSRLSRVQYSDLSAMQEVVINSLAELLKPYVRVDVREEMRVGRTAMSSAYEKYTRARGYLNNWEVESNIDAAINLLKAAASEDDRYALVYAGLCEAYLQKYKTTWDTSYISESIKNGVTACDLDPTLAPARLALGRTYLERGDYDNAESELAEAFSLMPQSAAVQYNLARVYEGKDEVDRAEHFYLEAIRLKPDYWQYHNGIGIFYHYEGRHEEALTAFLRVIELRSDNPWGYNNLGAQYLELGQQEKALAQFLRAREVNPRVTEAIAYANDNMARVFYAERDFETAAGMFEEAVDIQDLSYDSWDQLGNAYFKLDRLDDARSAWERVVELVGARLAVNPNDRNALNYVSEAYAKLGRRRPAFSNLYHLLSLDRVRPTDYVVAAKVHDILGQRDSALHYVEVAFKSGAEVGDVERSIWLDELRADARYTNAVALESQDE
jgi:serine/threonine-protein kinase